MDSLERHRVSLQRRMIASGAIYVVFMIVASIAAVRGTTFDDNVLLLIIVLLIGSVSVLPRSTMPRRWPQATTADGQDRLDMMRDTLIAMQNRATYQRLFYFAIGILLIAVLPLVGI